MALDTVLNQPLTAFKSFSLCYTRHFFKLKLLYMCGNLWSACDFSYICERIWARRAGPVVKNLPANAGDVDLIPGRETNIPHAMKHLSQCTRTTEAPMTWSPHAITRESVHCNKRSHMT